MSTLISGISQRQLLLGQQVTKSITAANGIITLFNITGGRAVITSLVGRVTTLIGATTSNLKLTYNPTAAGTSFDLCTATAVETDAVEQAYYLTGAVGSVAALQVAGAVGQANPVFSTPYTFQAGTIEANFSADPVGGVISWALTWVPLDTGASVAAA